MATVPDQLPGLLDDAADLPPTEAVARHLRHRSAWYAGLVGSLVVGDGRLPRLATSSPVPVTVVVTGGAGAIEPAVRWADRQGIELRGLRVAMRESDAGDSAPNVRRICTALDALLAAGDLDEDVPVYVEPPPLRDDPSMSWLGALDEVAAVDHRLALRTRGSDGDLESTGIARFIGAALDRELAFTAVGGVGRAVRQSGPEGGHGLLNLLLATRASLDGAGVPDVAAVLDEVDPAALTTSAGMVGLAGAHRWLTSVSCADLTRSVADLVELGLADPAAG